MRSTCARAKVLLHGHPPDHFAVACRAGFLASEGHNLLIAYVNDEPAGMVTGVEMTHQDKGTEMFLYELGVDAGFRGRGSAGPS